MDKSAIRKIFIVSDGTCRTCEHVVNAALVQFTGEKISISRRANVTTSKKATKVVTEAAKAGAIIFHTLASEEARAFMKEAAQNHMVPTVDILGPVLSALNFSFTSSPINKPGLMYKAHKEYFDRIDAIDYTLKHDDGVRAHDLHKADVVLVGVSRVSKSSTCFYLGYRGIRAANVPLFVNQDPPPELLKIDPHKVIGLTTNLSRLQSVRQTRLVSMGVSSMLEYVDSDEVASEIRAANILMAKYGWRSIDVSYKAIEEVARAVLILLEKEKEIEASD